MNKKMTWSLLTVMMVAMLSVCFASCSDDEDDFGSVSDEIVGTWKGSFDNRFFVTLTFNSDGTGVGYREGYNRSGQLTEIWEYDFKWGRKGNIVSAKAHFVISELLEDKTEEGTGSWQFDYDGSTLSIGEGAFNRITTFNKQ